HGAAIAHGRGRLDQVTRTIIGGGSGRDGSCFGISLRDMALRDVWSTRVWSCDLDAGIIVDAGVVAAAVSHRHSDHGAAIAHGRGSLEEVIRTLIGGESRRDGSRFGISLVVIAGGNVPGSRQRCGAIDAGIIVDAC